MVNTLKLQGYIKKGPSVLIVLIEEAARPIGITTIQIN